MTRIIPRPAKKTSAASYEITFTTPDGTTETVKFYNGVDGAQGPAGATPQFRISNSGYWQYRNNPNAEFLPISSTGHLILFGHLIDFKSDSERVFEVVIQLGAILAVCWLYRQKIIALIQGFFSGDMHARRL